MQARLLIKTGRITAIVSFVIGTIIFGFYYFTSSNKLLFVGGQYILIVIIINLSLLIAIVVKLVKEKLNRKRLLSTCKLMLLNIPIAALYFWVVIVLLDTMRITFTNTTQAELTDINIIGCDDAQMKRLEAGKSKTIWISIKKDCAITINYNMEGQRKKENVLGYTCQGIGNKMEYSIKGENSRD